MLNIFDPAQKIILKPITRFSINKTSSYSGSYSDTSSSTLEINNINQYYSLNNKRTATLNDELRLVSPLLFPSEQYNLKLSDIDIDFFINLIESPANPSQELVNAMQEYLRNK